MKTGTKKIKISKTTKNIFPDNRKKKAGYTFIEVLFIIVIVALLAGIVIPRLTSSSEQAREAARDALKATINRQVERYHVSEGVWPADDLSDLENNDDYFLEDIPNCPVCNGPITLDSDTHRAICACTDPDDPPPPPPPPGCMGSIGINLGSQ